MIPSPDPLSLVMPGFPKRYAQILQGPWIHGSALKVTIFVRDKKTLEKGQMEMEGDRDKLMRQMDQQKMFLTKRGFEILDWKADLEDGKTASMGREACTSCGRPGTATFNKVEKTPDGILLSRIHLSLCQRHFDRFTRDPKARAELMTLGLQSHVIAPQTAGSGEE